MKFFITLFALIAMSLFLVSCEEIDGDNPESEEYATLADVPDIAPGEQGGLKGDAPDSPIIVTITNLLKIGEAKSKLISFTIENVSNNELEVTPIVNCMGLINTFKTKKLETVILESGQSKIVEFPVNLLPIQSTVGVSQIVPEFEYRIGSNAPVRTIMMAPFYYKHEIGYEEINMFGQETLFDIERGRLSGGGDLAQNFEGALRDGTLASFVAPELGRVMEDNGNATIVSLMDESLVDIQDGEVVGYLTGMSLELGSDID